MLATELLVLIAASAPSAEANTRAAIARIGRSEAHVHAVIAIDPTALDQARALDRSRDRGPLFGMTILLKDNIEAKGPLPTTAGSLALLSNVTGRDAPVVAQLRTSGAVILGKTNLSEWANFRSSYAVSGWSAVGGQTRNPHVLDRNPCGSSSGSAVAVAEGLVDAAIGTETNGSITCPASLNGVVGLKPTVGLVSRSHIVPISRSQDTAGPLAKDVATAARVLSAIAGGDPADPATAEADAHQTNYSAALTSTALKGARIGVVRLAGWSPAVDTLFERALRVLQASGAILVDITPPVYRAKIGPPERLVLLTEFKVGLNEYLASTPPAVRSRTLSDLIAFDQIHADRELALFGQDLFEQAERTKGLEEPAYRAARALSRRLAGLEGIDAMLTANAVEALVSPTMSPAWKTDSVNGDPSVTSGPGDLAAIAGYPHLSVPMGTVHCLPVGLSFIGPAWSDARLLAMGYAFERAGPARSRPRFRASLEERPRPAHPIARNAVRARHTDSHC